MPLWIETEGAVQHVIDYINRHDIAPPSALSSSDRDGEEDGDENEEEDEGGDDDDEGEGGSEEEEGDASDKNGDGKKRALDEEGDEEDEEGEEEVDGSNNLDMYINMYETAIDMAADSL